MARPRKNVKEIISEAKGEKYSSKKLLKDITRLQNILSKLANTLSKDTGTTRSYAKIHKEIKKRGRKPKR